MPAARAERLCPDPIFVPPDFTRYLAASRMTREIFKRHTDLAELRAVSSTFSPLRVLAA